MTNNTSIGTGGNSDGKVTSIGAVTLQKFFAVFVRTFHPGVDPQYGVNLDRLTSIVGTSRQVDTSWFPKEIVIVSPEMTNEPMDEEFYLDLFKKWIGRLRNLGYHVSRSSGESGTVFVRDEEVR